MNEELRTKIENYLGGNMSAAEADDFNRQIESDPDLRAEVMLSAEINFHLSEQLSDSEIPDNEYSRNLKTYFQSAEAKEVKAKLDKVREEYAREGVTTNRPKFYLFAAVLTFLIITTVGMFFFRGIDSSELYTAYYSEQDVPSVVTRGDVSALKEGAAAFQKKDYQTAMEFLDEYFEGNNDINPSVYIYSGVTRLELGKEMEAISEFDKLISSNSLDSSKGLWFKALAYLKMDDIAEAKKVLETITSSSSNFNYEKAKELLAKL
jgi:tetratricopeptide (TPR) repeat protein